MQDDKVHLADMIEGNYQLADYLPLVEQCAINVRIVVRCFLKKNDTTCLGGFLFLRYRNVFIGWINDVSNLKIDADNDWGKKIVHITFELMILSKTHRKVLIALLIFIAIGLLFFFNVFLLGFIAFAVLIIYIPIMKVNKDLENYCVLNVSHSRYNKQNEKGDVNSSEIKMIDGLDRLITIKDLLFNDIPTSSSATYNLTERTYIESVVKGLDITNKYIESIVVLTKDLSEKKYSFLI